MASFFGHAVLGFAIAKLSVPARPAYRTGRRESGRKGLVKAALLCMLCAVIPDLDFIGFKMGVPYDSTFGHRGISHSILFAVFLAVLLRYLFYSSEKFNSRRAWSLTFLFFVCTISHALLDSLTTGGLGVAYFAPFSNKRYFFHGVPYRFHHWV